MSNSKQEMIMKKSMMVVGADDGKYNPFLPKGIKLIPVRMATRRSDKSENRTFR